MKHLFACASIVTLLPVLPSFAQEQILVDLHDILPKSVTAKGFTLTSEQEISITAVGIRTSRQRPALASAWILDAATREVVWELTESNTQSYDRYLSKFEGVVKLPAGNYLAFYAFFAYHDGNWRASGFGEAMAYLFSELFYDRRDWHDDWSWHGEEKIDREKFKDLGVVIRGHGKALPDEEIESLTRAFQNDALISITGLWDDEYKKRGFTLDQQLEIEIYALGEARYDEEYDYGWILNAKTREKVWQFDYDHSRPAGGAVKNRMAREILTLPAGSYAVFWVTDDSHSYHRWNSPPPYDPEFWGLTVRVRDPAMKKAARAFEYEDVPAQNVFLQITRVRDDEFRSEGFSLKQPTEVRIYALGEGRDGEMFDYGWIVDTQTRKKAWQMDYDKTDHAGGGEKNRVFDATIRLEPGNYMAYYTSDGTHSYRDWNTSPPIDQEHWGLTLMTAGATSPAAVVAPYKESEAKEIVAQIINVRDDQHRQVDFRLPQNAQVRIYALGEGRDGDMFDYGWIEDSRSGRVVWEMTYRMTEHAGGGRKNRMLDDTISLKAGEYALHYKSDGSHSWHDWNTSPPHDPGHWGITLYRVGK